MSEPYVVYKHTDPDTGEQLFVGMGEIGRAWRLSRDNEDHTQWLQDLIADGWEPADWVTVLETGLSEEDAKKSRNRLIKTLDPRFNVRKFKYEEEKKPVVAFPESSSWVINEESAVTYDPYVLGMEEAVDEPKVETKPTGGFAVPDHRLTIFLVALAGVAVLALLSVVL